MQIPPDTYNEQTTVMLCCSRPPASILYGNAIVNMLYCAPSDLLKMMLVHYSTSSRALMCFLKNSNAEKNTALTAADLPMDTPSPLYMSLLKKRILGIGTLCPLEYISALRW